MKFNVKNEWDEMPSPKASGANAEDGWFGEFDMCWRYQYKYVVMARKINTQWGEVIHACMRNARGADITWAEKQWIKESLFGENVTAIEVFPKADRLVDAANMYHLWIFEESFDLPFGIHEDDIQPIA